MFWEYVVQKMALSWMVHRESGRNGPCGGILADDQVRFVGAELHRCVFCSMS